MPHTITSRYRGGMEGGRRELRTGMHRDRVKWMRRSGSLPSETRRDIRQRDFFTSIQMKLILMTPWPWTCSSSKIHIFSHLSALYYLGQQIASGTILGLTTCCYLLCRFFVLLLLFDAFAFKVMYLPSFGDPKVLYPPKGLFSPLSPGRSLNWDIYPTGLHFCLCLQECLLV